MKFATHSVAFLRRLERTGHSQFADFDPVSAEEQSAVEHDYQSDVVEAALNSGFDSAVESDQASFDSPVNLEIDVAGYLSSPIGCYLKRCPPQNAVAAERDHQWQHFWHPSQPNSNLSIESYQVALEPADSNSYVPHSDLQIYPPGLDSFAKHNPDPNRPEPELGQYHSFYFQVH